MNPVPQRSGNPERFRGWPGVGLGAALLATVAAIGIAGFFYLQSVTVAARKVATDNLAAVAESKVREIVNWRAERLSDAQAVMQNPLLTEPVQRFLAGPADAASTARLTQWLHSLQEHNQALRAILVDAECRVRLVFPADKTYFGPIAAASAKEAMATNHVTMSELHRSQFSGEVHMDLVVPIRSTAGAAPVGAVVLEVDPERFLFPLIQTWPTASPSAETLLVRREGNDVLFLNELRHRKDAALTLRLPIGQKDLPAARAVRGETGVMEGVDNRGVPVLAHVRAVPGTKWFMVAKVDAAEINAPLRQQALLISVSVGLFLLVIGLGAGLFWRQQRTRYYREQVETAAELVIANKELLFQNEEKEKRAAELVVANKELSFQNEEKEKRAAELVIANKELSFQNEEKEKRAAELVVANKELLFQNEEKEKRAAELAVANKELLFQNEEKEKRAAELVIANKELLFQNDEKEKRAAELERSKSELARFLYTASHDLKSPVVTVRTFLGYLEQDMATGDAGRIAKDVQFIRNATDKMVQLLDDLLEMSRIGRVVGASVNVTFRALVDTALAAVAGRIAARGVTVQVDDREMTLHGDRVRLEEIWQNLVDNACKFMGDQKAPRIEIGVETRDAEPVFFVRDNGVGIDARYQEKVFGLFEKLDPKAEGTGIGLALVKRIVELHGGRIWVESKGAGQGTCFCFTLPGAMQKETSP